MTVFPFQIGEVTGLYNRVLKSRDLSMEAETTELKDVMTLSAEARRQKILEETKNAVLSQIKSGQ